MTSVPPEWLTVIKSKFWLADTGNAKTTHMEKCEAVARKFDIDRHWPRHSHRNIPILALYHIEPPYHQAENRTKFSSPACAYTAKYPRFKRILLTARFHSTILLSTWNLVRIFPCLI